MKYIYTIIVTSILLLNICHAEKVYLFENFKSLNIPSSWKNLDIDTNELNPSNGLKSLLKKGIGWTIQYEDKYGMGLCAVSTSWFAQDGQADDWLITNEIELGENVLLTWDAGSEYYSSGYKQSYQVLISSTGTNIDDFKVVQDIKDEYPLCHRRLDINGYSGKKIYLAFRNISQNVKNGFLCISNIKVFSPELNDMAVTRLIIPAFDTLGGPGITIKSYVENNGYNDVDTFEIKYQINDGEIHSATFNRLIHNHGNWIAEHPVIWNPDSAKEYFIKVWISKVNGVDDPIQKDNEISQNVYICSNYSDKLPLYEEFTSSTCGPCATANRIFDPYLEKRKGKYVLVKYQMIGPGPGEIYYNQDGIERSHFYNLSYIPDLRVNGRYIIQPSDTASINYSSPEAGLLDVTGTYNVYQENVDYKIDVNVDLKSYFTGNGSDKLVLYVAIVENKTTKNASSNGETEFHMVEQKMLPDGYGTPLTDLLNVDKLSKTFSYTFDSTSHVEEYGDLSVVIFVQDKTTKLVLGTAWATWVGVSVDDNVNDGNGIAGLFPNPATNNIYVRYNVRNTQNVSIDIYNLVGEKISTNNTKIIDSGTYVEDINTSGLVNGAYILGVNIGSKTYSKLFIVNK